MSRKKLVSLAMAVSMLSAMTVAPVSATEETNSGYEGYAFTPANWTVVYQSNHTKWDVENDYMGISFKNGIDGSNALGACVNSLVEAHRYIHAYSNLTQNLENGKTYRIGMWVKGEGKNFGTTILTDDDYRVNFTNYDKGEVSGEWTYYSKDITIAEDEAKVRNTIRFVFDRTADYVIDNVTLNEVTNGEVTGENLVVNGGFEDYVENWSNMLDEGGVYNNSFNKWATQIGPGLDATEQLTHYVKATSKYARNGEYALYVAYPDVDNGNEYLQMDGVKTKLIAGKEYVLEWWAKGKNYVKPNNNQMGFVWRDGFYGSMKNAPKEIDENGWSRYECKFNIPEGTDTSTWNLRLMFSNTGTWVVDDLKLYAVDEPEVNYITDGGFEDVNNKYLLAENKYTPANWTNQLSNVTAAENSTDLYIEPSAREKHSGNYSLHLSYNEAATSNKFIKYYQANTFKAGKYYLEFYAKGSVSNIMFGLGWHADWYLASAINNGVIKKGETDANGWTKYTAEFTRESDISQFVIQVDRPTDMYMDDIKLCAEGSDVNLLTNGGFEDVTVKNTTSVVNLMAYPVTKGNGLNISWTNPGSNYIEDIKVFVDGNRVINNPADLKASAFNQMYVTDLENGKEYTVKVVITVDGNSYEAETKGVPDNAGASYYMAGWTVNRFNKVENSYPVYTNANFSIDSEEKYSGNSSVRLDLNIPATIGNVFPNITNTVSLNRNTIYQLKFKAKTQNAARLGVITQSYVYDEAGTEQHYSWVEKQFVGNALANTDWTEYTFVLDNMPCGRKHDGENLCNQNIHDLSIMTDDKYTANIIIKSDKGAGSVWIDDVELYAIDPADYIYDQKITPTGKNIIENGGFEYTYELGTPSYKMTKEDAVVSVDKLDTGDVEVSAWVKNYTMGNDFNAMIGVALYDGTKLVDYTIMEKKVSSASLAIPAEKYTSVISVPDVTKGEYSIKVMYWDGIQTMKALGEASIITE